MTRHTRRMSKLLFGNSVRLAVAVAIAKADTDVYAHGLARDLGVNDNQVASELKNFEQAGLLERVDPDPAAQPYRRRPVLYRPRPSIFWQLAEEYFGEAHEESRHRSRRASAKALVGTSGLDWGELLERSRHEVPGDEDVAASLILEETLQALTDGDRRLLLLRYGADLPSPAIAEALGISEGAVRVRLHRARSKMRAAMSEPKNELGDAPSPRDRGARANPPDAGRRSKKGPRRIIDAPDPADVTVLFGAGVTRAAGGPTAFDLVDAIAEALVADKATRQWVVSNIQPRGDLRFETAIDALAGIADSDLKVLDLFELLQPGHLHSVLGWAAANGARLVTVNFDDLVEQAIGTGALTVDLYEKLNVSALERLGAVVKLHGTQRVHHGRRRVEDRGSSRLQATIASIVASGGGAGLRPDLEERLRALVDDRALVVVGYSGSDDLDVIPSLERCAPARVVWVQHGAGEPRPGSADELTAGSAALAQAWVRGGARVDVVVGPTDKALIDLGWPVEAAPEGDMLKTQEWDWRDHVRKWAARARGHDPTGLAWAGELQATLGRFDDAHRSLERSRTSTRPKGLWTPARRQFSIAENAYLRDLPLRDVRCLAEEALAAADADGDGEHAAQALHVIARSYRTGEPPDLPAARDALDRAEARLRDIDDPGLMADIVLERARIAVAENDDGVAAELAGRAADAYRSGGHYHQVSEALQVRAHALTLDGDHDEALNVLAEATRIAHNGRYPEREIAAAVTAAALADDLGRIERVIEHAETAIDIANRTRHLAEVAQMYAYLGLARSEQGRFAEAAAAFRQGLLAVGPSTRKFLPLLVCGLADTLLHLDEPEEAQRLLDEHRDQLEADDRHRPHARLLDWVLTVRRGEHAEWDDAIVEEAAFNGQMAFALARLAQPSPRVRAYLEGVRQHLERVGQHDRLARLAAGSSAVRRAFGAESTVAPRASEGVRSGACGSEGLRRRVPYGRVRA